MSDKIIVTKNGRPLHTLEDTAGDLEASDGYHTFTELYDHRIALFIALMHSHPNMSWRSDKHHDGSEMEGWFIAGMNLPSGPITYHLPQQDWNKLSGIKVFDRAPKFDGHTSEDVVARLNKYSEIIADEAVEEED